MTGPSYASLTKSCCRHCIQLQCVSNL